MDDELSGPLGSYPDRDEFQIGRMLVWVYYLEGDDRLLRLSKANAIFPALLAEISKVEVMASKFAGNNLYLQIIGISIKPDGIAKYTCRHEDDDENEIDIVRAGDGRLMLL
ncbi:hypothetical protein ACO0LD_15015 [Undibacterium sp. Ji83W]|uniref:hypothetical protein n=1 Tax=Undibacterium sp. Ji83W TaxID=3413043 RepID=UPI003BF28F37